MAKLDDEKERATVLVADDEEINRLILRELLQGAGHRVLEAADGEAALTAVAEGGVDLVLLDVVMPGMDGVETCKRIREELDDLVLPVVFVTSLDDRASRVRGKAAGGDDFLTKPVDAIELMARVGNLLRVKAYHDLRARQQELLEAELARTREQLLRADRLATLGTLAAGVGHELANIAAVQMATLDAMAMDIADGLPQNPGDTKALRTVGTHITTHARHLLDYGRPGPDHAEPMNLCGVVNQTLEMLRVSTKTKYVSVFASLPPEPVEVTVNRTRIEQVLVNLVGNAVDALSDAAHGEPRVTVGVEPPGHAERVSCWVADNGCGIPADRLEMIFEPYFTTKAPGRGTGLGLPVIRNIIQSYGGEVSVTSEEGRGTRISFDLPRDPPASSAAHDPSSPAACPPPASRPR